MAKSALISTAAVLAGVAGFVLATGAQAQACPNNSATCRNVRVTVEGGQIVINPAPVTITGRTAPTVKIVWYLDTPGYRFVDVSNNRPVNFAADYFMSNDPRFCYPWTSDTMYVCSDWNADVFETTYTLKVAPVSGSAVAPVTARLVNN